MITGQTRSLSMRPTLTLGLAAAALFGMAAPAVQAAGAERSLAGVSIFAPGSVVTRKFGNPNQILVGGAAPAAFTPGSSAGGAGSSAGAPGGGGFPGASGGGGFPGAPSGTGSLPGFPGGAPGGGFPGAPGGSFLGASGGGAGLPGSAAAAGPVKPAYTYIYNRANGGSLEFTISPDKRVVQIRETGYSGAFGTARGIKLGTTYAAVVNHYGSPENIEISGSIINIDYRNTLHCGFQFLDQRLVGIIVASPD